ncbi:MAG TPA: EamA family transporter [Candidatus Gallacutalibacter stercoravium]|nr:EamA family transporter [Candidatus Gallacutalibacter stercoravium]
MYYGLIFLAVVMFGGCFALNDVYRNMRGSSMKISLQFTLISSLAGLLVLLAANGFSVACTPFTLIIALLAAVNSIGFTFCGFKALGIINLSLYSLYSMLGGMMLPFLQGILCYGESFTTAKIICLGFICAALLLTVKKGETKRGTIYYIGIFVLNGMSGVLSKFFASAPYPKTDAASYSILTALCSAILAGLIFVFFFGKKDDIPKSTPPSVVVAALGGIVNRIANLILIVALAHVDASAQYPLVTGGVMIVSTVICFFRKNKPSKKEVLSIVLSFIGMLSLFVIPI